MNQVRRLFGLLVQKFVWPATASEVPQATGQLLGRSLADYRCGPHQRKNWICQVPQLRGVVHILMVALVVHVSTSSSTDILSWSPSSIYADVDCLNSANMPSSVWGSYSKVAESMSHSMTNASCYTCRHKFRGCWFLLTKVTEQSLEWISTDFSF